MIKEHLSKLNSIASNMALRIKSKRIVVMRALALATSLGCLVASVNVHAQYFRYLNENGTKVIASSIPPEAVPRGYEIINSSGEVIDVIAPAPKKEDLAQVAKEIAILEKFDILARRYSSESDIFAARDRQVAHLDANIKILQGNINTLNSQLDDLMQRAANYERQGKKIPEFVFENIEKVKSEIATTKRMLTSREQDHKEIFDDYQKDVDLFKEGKKLLEKRATASAETAD